MTPFGLTEQKGIGRKRSDIASCGDHADGDTRANMV